jgi:hypothetical protein
MKFLVRSEGVRPGKTNTHAALIANPTKMTSAGTESCPTA